MGSKQTNATTTLKSVGVGVVVAVVGVAVDDYGGVGVAFVVTVVVDYVCVGAVVAVVVNDVAGVAVCVCVVVALAPLRFNVHQAARPMVGC